MKSVLHKSESRGEADYGWLKPKYSFSFANYYHPDRMGFGALRVLNDDAIDSGRGFDEHAHHDMEIITIPLSGGVFHKDSIGNEGEITAGEVQIMSAGSGIRHSEYNLHEDQPLNLLQIWIIPNSQGVEPRYDQMKIEDVPTVNYMKNIISPNKSNSGLFIQQNAWLSLADVPAGKEITYSLNDKVNGTYVFVIEGEANIAKTDLKQRDALGIWDTKSFKIKPDVDSQLLIIEVPFI